MVPIKPPSQATLPQGLKRHWLEYTRQHLKILDFGSLLGNPGKTPKKL